MAQQAQGIALEIGCGTGRILIPIAKSGTKIVGLDSSKSMFSVCLQKLKRESKDVQTKVELMQADAIQFDLYWKFDLIIMPFRAFQHLQTMEDQLTCLSNIYNHLTDKGRFILDLFNPSLSRLVGDRYLKEVDEEPEFQMPDGRSVIRRHRYTSAILQIKFWK